MLKTIATVALTAVLAGPLGAQGLPDAATKSERLIFASRDWSGVAAGLAWSLDREGPAGMQGFLPVADGQLRLAQVTDPSDGKPMVEMHEVDDTRDRVVGRYPMAGIDPVLIYFLETTTRNMSALTGGNANYIRNRIKAAMRDGGSIEALEGGGQRMVLVPFAGDPAADRMRGFQSMRLTFTLPADGDAPITALAAEAPDAGYALRLAQVAP